jgi:hypothetical protein
MLLGLRDSTFEVGATDQGRFFLSATVLYRASRLIFEFIGVYGPVDHARSRNFLEELEAKVDLSQYPVVVAGDFNSFVAVLIKITRTLTGLGFVSSMTLLLEWTWEKSDVQVLILHGLINKPTRFAVCSIGCWFLLFGREDFP